MNLRKEKNIHLNILTVLMVCIIAAALIIWEKGIGIEEIISLSGSNILLALVILMGLYATKGIVMFIPMMALYLAGGALFKNIFVGMAVNILGIIICISVGYFNGTRLSGEKIEKIYRKYPRISELKVLQQENSLFFSYIIRVVGMLPCDLVSLYCGIQKIPYRHFVLGSVLGMLPGVILTSIMGASLQQPMSPQFIISACLQIATSFISIFVYFKVKKKYYRKET